MRGPGRSGREGPSSARPIGSRAGPKGFGLIMSGLQAVEVAIKSASIVAQDTTMWVGMPVLRFASKTASPEPSGSSISKMPQSGGCSPVG